jgi:hypothetical protein
VGQGFSVNTARLQAASQEVGGLLGRCGEVGADAVAALAGMAGSAGHPGLASALTGAAGQGASTFQAMGVVYQHVSASLVNTAAAYASTEQAIATRAGAVLRGIG